MSQKTYTCYGCKQVVEYKDLRYECMCIDRNGLCKMCIVNKVEFVVPLHHNLRQLHDLSDEYTAYFDEVQEKIGAWNSMVVDRNNNYVFKSYQIKGQEQGSIQEFEQDQYNPNGIVKTLIRQSPPEKLCKCCVQFYEK